MRAGCEVTRVEGLRSRGAESLAMRAGGLLFTSALGVGSLDGHASVGVLGGVGRVLRALGSAPDKVAKAKLFRNTMDGDDLVGESLAQRFPHAAMTVVGAAPREPRDSFVAEFVAGETETPESFRDAAGAILATRLGPLVFTAGCGPFAGDRVLAAGDLGGQGRRALEAVCAALDRAGAGPASLVKINNTAACWHDYRRYNEAYNAVLDGSNAARCSVGGALRHPLSLIEVEAVASLRPGIRYVDSTRSGVGRDHFVPRSDTVYRPDLGPCKGPHSHGARTGDIVFIAGECPYDAEDRLIGPGDIAVQTARTLENVRLSLEALGAGLDDVIKTSVTLSDSRLIPAFEGAYREAFAFPYPARSLVAAPLGQYGILVEIEAIAVVGGSRMAAVGQGEG